MARIAPFAGMRFEHQVIAHPYRIETVRFGTPRALTAIIDRHLFAEMGQQETEFELCCHDVVPCRGIDGIVLSGSR